MLIFFLLRSRVVVDKTLNTIANICLLLRIDKIYFFTLKTFKNFIKILIRSFISFYNFSEKLFSFNNFEKTILDHTSPKNLYNLNLITEKFIEKLAILLMYFFLYIAFKSIIIYHLNKRIYLNKIDLFTNLCVAKLRKLHIHKLYPITTGYSISILSTLFIYWALIQTFILRDYLEMPIILKYNILVTLIIYLIFYAFVHIFISFCEDGNSMNSITIIRYMFYTCINAFFINLLIYFCIKAITIKEKEHIIKKKNIFLYISKSFYFWIKHGIRVKKKRENSKKIK